MGRVEWALGSSERLPNTKVTPGLRSWSVCVCGQAGPLRRHFLYTDFSLMVNQQDPSVCLVRPQPSCLLLFYRSVSGGGGVVVVVLL